MHLIIYLVAFLEGFTTLSVEIIALRNFTPIIGNNSISTSIVLGVILLALSYGYYIGGKISANSKNIKNRLVINLLIAGLYYFFISFIFSSITLELFLGLTGSYFFSIIVSSILLFFIPVFLASQTIPLLAEILKGKHSGEKMGKLLFYSTIGSFIGSVSTSSLFFPLIGVEKTGLISPILLTLSAVILSVLIIKNKKLIAISSIILLFFILSTITLNIEKSDYIFKVANSYHNIEVKDIGKKRLLLQNGAYSSGINKYTKESYFSYIKEVKNRINKNKPKNILIIGAAGFTLPNEISEYSFITNIDVVDIDGTLKNITEKYFLNKKLNKKIRFYAEPSRFFINKVTDKKYDFILIDAYSGKSLPPQTLTLEFFNKLNEVGDNIYMNLVLDKKLNSSLSKNIFKTINKSFGKSYYKDVNDNDYRFTNIVITNQKVINYSLNELIPDTYYTDNKNSIELDKFKLQ